jgi:hypothetical protein
MNSKYVIRSVALMGLVVFAVSGVNGEPVKTSNDRNRATAERAKSMMAKDKKLHDSVVAAIKAKDTTKVQSLFSKAGLKLPEIRFGPNQCCIFLPPFHPGGGSDNIVCCN